MAAGPAAGPASRPGDQVVSDRRRLAARVALGALVVVYALMAALPAHRGSNLILATEPPPDGAGASPGWLLGPLQFAGAPGADGPLAGPLFYAGLWVALLLYVAVLLLHRGLSMRLAVYAVVGLHVLFMLAPPLLSQDVFSYIAYARLGAEHGLDPYTHRPFDLPTDPVFGYAGSKDAVSAYGPVFTLLSYALVPLSVSAAFWTLKVLVAAASLGTVQIVRRTAERLGREGMLAGLVVGLNPLVLVHVVGGAHNEAFVMLATVAGIALWCRGREPAGAAVSAAATAIKASAGLVVPFLVAGARSGRVKALAAVVGAGVAILAIAFIGFGSHALDALSLLSSNQERSSRFSFPYKTSQLLAAVFGGDRLDYRDMVRYVYAVAFAGVLVWLLWRTWRGADAIRMAGWATLAILVASAWLVPWYALWLLPLAAIAADRRLIAASIVLCAWMLPIAVPL
jgi:alpha-1,6-mannosyltransferase